MTYKVLVSFKTIIFGFLHFSYIHIKLFSNLLIVACISCLVYLFNLLFWFWQFILLRVAKSIFLKWKSEITFFFFFFGFGKFTMLISSLFIFTFAVIEFSTFCLNHSPNDAYLYLLQFLSYCKQHTFLLMCEIFL